MALATDSAAEPDEQGRKLAAFRPIRLHKASHAVATAIVDAIRGGLFEPGERLPRERELAERLEVSRNVVREAVATLAAAGIVSVRRGNSGGIFVETRWIPPSVLAEVEGPTHRNVREILEARRMLERTAALMAAERAGDADLDGLAALVDQLDDLLDAPEEFIAVDLQFHLRIGELSGNALIAASLRQVIERYIEARQHYPVGHIELARGISNQRDTLAALRTRRPAEIVRAVDDHLGSVEEYFLGERLRDR